MWHWLVVLHRRRIFQNATGRTMIPRPIASAEVTHRACLCDHTQAYTRLTADPVGGTVPHAQEPDGTIRCLANVADAFCFWT